MPKPHIREGMDELLLTVEQEQQKLLEMIDEQKSHLAIALRACFNRMKDKELEVHEKLKDPKGFVAIDGQDSHTRADWNALPASPTSATSPTTATVTELTHPNNKSPSATVGHGHNESTRSLKREKTAQELLGLQNFVDQSKVYVDFVAGTLVLLNSMVMLVEMELEGQAAGAHLGLLSTGPRLEHVQHTFAILDLSFVCVFTLELLFRLLVEKGSFISDFANAFDTALVILGWLAWLFGGFGFSAMDDLLIMRMFRVLKSLRAVRLLRTFRFFKGLRFLVKACYCFLPSLLWAMVLLAVFICIGALVQGSLLQDFILDDAANLDDRKWIWNRYGTSYRAAYTFYEITFAGNWPTSARPVMEKAGHPFAIIFIVYVTFVVFATLRVVTAVFLKDTLDAARNDDEAMVSERLRNREHYVNKLESVFKAITGDSDGLITEERLTSVLENPKAQAYFQTLDLDILESHSLFRMLDNGDGVISHEEFVDGIVRCKGPARAMEQVAMRAELKQIDSKVTKLINALQEGHIIHDAITSSWELKPK